MLVSFAAVAQLVKQVKQRCNIADLSPIPSCGIVVREKILALPSVGVGGNTRMHR